MTDELDPPEGWRFSATPGWSLDDPDGGDFLPELIRVGHVLLPQRFYLAAGTPGMWPSKGSPFPGQDDFVVFLHFFVRHGELRLMEVRGAGIDLTKSLGALQGAVPARLWRQIAIREITEFLTSFDEAQGWPEEYFTPTRTDEWTQTIHEYLAERQQTRSSSDPVKRRNRITEEHLKQVSESYLTADALGLPPTKAVAQDFNTSHSTAAKWVGAARRKGLLPAPELLPKVQQLRRREAELQEVRADREATRETTYQQELDLVIEGIEDDVAKMKEVIDRAIIEGA